MQSRSKPFLQANNLSFKYEGSDEYLFEELSLSLEKNDRIGLIGRNGSGKSTLLKILANIMQPTTGRIICDKSVEYVSQTIPNDNKLIDIDETVSDYILNKDAEIWDVISILNNLFKWDIDTELQTSSLSGGEFTKLKIALAISKDPTILFLDEPTNHIDLSAIHSLEKYLAVFAGSLVLVSHNISFLNNVTRTIWELDSNTNKIKTYGGNYDFYSAQKESEMEVMQSKLIDAKKERKRIIGVREQMEKTKATRAKAGRKKLENRRILKSQFNMMKSGAEAYYGRRNTEIIKQLDEVEDDIQNNKAQNYKTAQIKLATNLDSNKTLIDFEKGTLRIYDQILIKNLTFHTSHGDRIAIEGDNGSGKTTLLKSILKLTKNDTDNLQDIYLDATKSYISNDLQIIYLDQKYSLIDSNLTVLENMMSASPSTTTSYAKGQLGKYQFKNDSDIVKKASYLSGGETVRLALAMISVTKANMILLDEPANNLDIDTIKTFEDTLNRYTGAIVAISHDESFLENIKINKRYKIKNKKLTVKV